MPSVGKFFFREDAQGLSVLHAGVPAYSVRISPKQIQSHQTVVDRGRRETSCPLQISWFGPIPPDERDLVARLWTAVDEFLR